MSRGFTWLVAAGLMVGLAMHAAPACALWSASATVGVSLSTEEPLPAQPPVFRAGRSKATFVGGTGPFPTIAHVEPERIWLDFGVVAEGNSNNSREILLIDNPGPRPYALNASLSPELADLFSLATISPYSLVAGTTARLSMKLDTHGVAPGAYEGTLTISDLLGAFSREIPVRVSVVAPSAKTGPSRRPKAVVKRPVTLPPARRPASAPRSTEPTPRPEPSGPAPECVEPDEHLGR